MKILLIAALIATATPALALKSDMELDAELDRTIQTCEMRAMDRGYYYNFEKRTDYMDHCMGAAGYNWCYDCKESGPIKCGWTPRASNIDQTNCWTVPFRLERPK